MLTALASLAVLAAAPATSEPAAPIAQPALYSVRDADTTIYIFGTFHVLDPSIRWFEGSIEQAFDRADELVVETLPVPLSAPPHQAAAVAHHEATPAASFLATSRDAVRAGRAQGMSLEHGADMVLMRSAVAWGKTIEPLETLQSQYVMLSNLTGNAALPPPLPAAAPAAPADVGTLADSMTQLQAAWAVGDQGIFANMLWKMRAASPEAYRLMFLERNARWTDWVAARMRQPGTVFVAVGAGHLVGPDSLLVKLAQRGHVSRRVPR
jgi:uncharacterized protein YbaP (TraB family)